MEKNLKHMTNEHSFYIPDPEYMTDLAGFLTYLGMFSIEQVFSKYSAFSKKNVIRTMYNVQLTTFNSNVNR